MAKQKNIILPLVLVGAGVILALVLYSILFTEDRTTGRVPMTPPKPGIRDSFAQCLNQKGAVLYGTYWCSHCQNQKKLFGSSMQYVPYVECSSPDGQTQLQVCAEKGIEAYPTWIFGDGTRVEGEMSFSLLADKTGCPLPD